MNEGHTSQHTDPDDYGEIQAAPVIASFSRFYLFVPDYCVSVSRNGNIVSLLFKFFFVSYNITCYDTEAIFRLRIPVRHKEEICLNAA